MTLTPGWRRLVLLVHVTTSVGLLGAVTAFLALAIAARGGAATGLYAAMRLMTWDVIVPLLIAGLVVGIVSSLATPWGLVRHYWLAMKLGLTVVAVAVLLLQLRTIDALAAGTAGPDAGMAMILHAAGGLAVLIAATILSVYKPRGVTGLQL